MSASIDDLEVHALLEARDHDTCDKCEDADVSTTCTPTASEIRNKDVANAECTADREVTASTYMSVDEDGHVLPFPKNSVCNFKPGPNLMTRKISRRRLEFRDMTPGVVGSAFSRESTSTSTSSSTSISTVTDVPDPPGGPLCKAILLGALLSAIMFAAGGFVMLWPPKIQGLERQPVADVHALVVDPQRYFVFNTTTTTTTATVRVSASTYSVSTTSAFFGSPAFLAPKSLLRPVAQDTQHLASRVGRGSTGNNTTITSTSTASLGPITANPRATVQTIFQTFVHGTHINRVIDTSISRDAEQPTTTTKFPLAVALAAAASVPDCHTSVYGERCYDHVVWAMQHGVHGRPEWPRSLRESASFVEFQELVHRSFNSSCPMPCKRGEDDEERLSILKRADLYATGCHTSMPGETCYAKVSWAMKEGILVHPEWYKGLNKTSTFEEFQAHLQRDVSADCPHPCECHIATPEDACFDYMRQAIKREEDHPFIRLYYATDYRSELQEELHRAHGDAVCPKPCRPRVWNFPSIFCFSVFQAAGYEADNVRAQFASKAGIFACDDFAVVSDVRVLLGNTGMGPLYSLAIPPTTVGRSQDGTAANALVFMRAWEQIAKDLRYRLHDWTIKADPDTVLVPERMRAHLAQFTGRRVFVRNCNRYTGPGWPMMYGSVEAISVTAVTTYAENWQRCKSNLDWPSWGEDVFMLTCLAFLEVDSVEDMELVGDSLCTRADCSDARFAAYHPFKSPEAWNACQRQVSVVN